MFKFKFERLLTIRTYQKDLLENELGAMRNEMQTEKENLKQLYLAQNEKFTEMQDLLKGLIDMEKMHFYREFLDNIYDKIEVQKKVITQLKEQIETKKQQVIAATKKVKILEKLKEKEYQKFLKDEDIKEQNVLDELGQNIFVRKTTVN